MIDVLLNGHHSTEDRLIDVTLRCPVVTSMVQEASNAEAAAAEVGDKNQCQRYPPKGFCMQSLGCAMPDTHRLRAATQPHRVDL